MESILTEVQQEAEQLSQQNASSAGENTDPEETSPTHEVDMSQLYINKAGKSKGRFVGLAFRPGVESIQLVV
ncbi:hypothetical protein ACS0TY_005235 [Phlomoides rotata]